MPEEFPVFCGNIDQLKLITLALCLFDMLGDLLLLLSREDRDATTQQREDIRSDTNSRTSPSSHYLTRKRASFPNQECASKFTDPYPISLEFSSIICPSPFFFPANVLMHHLPPYFHSTVFRFFPIVKRKSLDLLGALPGMVKLTWIL